MYFKEASKFCGKSFNTMKLLRLYTEHAHICLYSPPCHEAAPSTGDTAGQRMIAARAPTHHTRSLWPELSHKLWRMTSSAQLTSRHIFLYWYFTVKPKTREYRKGDWCQTSTKNQHVK